VLRQRFEPRTTNVIALTNPLDSNEAVDPFIMQLMLMQTGRRDVLIGAVFHDKLRAKLNTVWGE
jgi:hypothetical protein